MGRLRTRVERLEQLGSGDALPDQSGHAGEFLTTDGTNPSWAPVAGGSGTVTSVGVSTGSSGVAVTGSPVTTTGTIDLGLGTAAAADTGDFDAAGDAAAAEAAANAYTDAAIAALPAVPTTLKAPIQFGAGSKSGSAIPTNNADAGGVLSYAYTIGTNWLLEVSPSISAGTFTLDLRRAASGAWPPTGADSITPSVGPSMTTGVEQSGTTSGWASLALAAGDAVDCVVLTNTAGVRWYRLSIESTRPL
jgi:hypothetical protein